MSKPLSFLRDEDGAVTVDWVVLTSIATATALGTVAILSAGVKSANREVEIQMGLTNSVSDTWVSAVRSYNPTDQDFYDNLYNDLSSLSDADLDLMSAHLLTMVDEMTPDAETSEEFGVLNDTAFAVQHVNADRVNARPEAQEVDQNEVARISAELGWDGQEAVAVDTPSVQVSSVEDTITEDPGTPMVQETSTEDTQEDDSESGGFWAWLGEKVEEVIAWWDENGDEVKASFDD